MKLGTPDSQCGMSFWSAATCRRLESGVMPPHSQKAFTLVELLVVVAIIAILLALLVPSMEEAFAHAQRTVCMSNQRQMHVANSSYAVDYVDCFVPVKTKTDPATNTSEAWLLNKRFIEGNGLTSKTPMGWLGWCWPEGFLTCPASKIVRAGWSKPFVWDTYGFNVAGITTNLSDHIGVRRSMLTAPVDKVQMTDTNDWWTAGKGTPSQEFADYGRYWDVKGDVDKFTQFMMVAYRHQQGAVVQHFDGHAEYYRKQQAWKGSAVADKHMWDVYE